MLLIPTTKKENDKREISLKGHCSQVIVSPCSGNQPFVFIFFIFLVTALKVERF